MKPRPSRTTNPLHFEDLEPHRFEDLVRQLVYGSRNWIVLEALGRAGADEGVDIRGIEQIGGSVPDDSEGDEEGQFETRVWYVQCKRERTFGPAKAQQAARDATASDADPPFGFILAVPCELSKRTRDTLSSTLHTAGVREVVAWGRSEIEDLLFLPENDHLLFAYFGISVQVRRRGLVTELRSRLTKKRQVYRAIGGLDHRGWMPVLVRDPTERGYPFIERVETFDPANAPWLWTAFRRHSNPDTLALIVQRHHAWISKDRKSFDFVDTCSHVVPHRNGFDKVPERDEELCDRLWRFYHNEIPQDERGWMEVVGWIPYDDILLVDDLGDAYNEPPHVLVTRDHQHGFFAHKRAFVMFDRTDDEKHIPVEELKRVNLFPEPIPDVEWRKDR
jgi:hypothetical protein